MSRSRKSIARSLLLGFLFSAFVTVAAMLLIAAALVYLRFGDRTLTMLNQILKLAAVVLGVCVAVPRGGERGLVTGVVIALLYSAAGYGMYLALGGGSFAVGNMLGEMLTGAAAGAVTGAVRANLPAHGRFKAKSKA